MTQNPTLGKAFLACMKKLNPKFADGYYARGLAHQTLGKNAESVADYDKCLMKESLNRRIEYAKYQRDKKKR
jgi:hypothetical protein